jgi:thioredoxin 1
MNGDKKLGITDHEDVSGPEWIIELDDSNFANALMSYEKIVVEFWKELCAPCSIMKPIYERISASYNDKVKTARAKVDLSPMIIRLFGIFNVPTILFFHRGKVVDTLIGIVSEQILEASFLKIYSV